MLAIACALCYHQHMEKEIIMYTDGGSRGNPGPAAIGIWIETLGIEHGECIGAGTNNEAEYGALIAGLKKLKASLGGARAKAAKVRCRLDSELVVKQLNHEYKLKDERIQKFFIEIWNLMLDFKEVVFEHIPREQNKKADFLVNKALDGKEKQGSLL